MTCICAATNGRKVTMGADSIGVNDAWEMAIRTDSKVFTVAEFLIGFTSSFRMGQILQYHLEPPRYHDEIDPMRYMVAEFIPEVRKVLSEHKFTTTKDDAEFGGLFLVGFRGRIFRIDVDFQVGERIEPYDAVGIGAPFALGAMRTAIKAPKGKVKLSDVALLQYGLDAASDFCAGVSGPFNFLSIGS